MICSSISFRVPLFPFCPIVCICFHISACLSVFLMSFCLSFSVSLPLSFSSLCLPICLSAYLSTCHLFSLSLCVTVCLSICLSGCLIACHLFNVSFCVSLYVCLLVIGKDEYYQKRTVAIVTNQYLTTRAPKILLHCFGVC